MASWKRRGVFFQTFTGCTFNQSNDEFSPWTMWSLSNAFTSAFKELDPVPEFKATAKLGAFLSQLPA